MFRPHTRRIFSASTYWPFDVNRPPTCLIYSIAYYVEKCHEIVRQIFLYEQFQKNFFYNAFIYAIALKSRPKSSPLFSLYLALPRFLPSEVCFEATTPERETLYNLYAHLLPTYEVVFFSSQADTPYSCRAIITTKGDIFHE